MGRGDGAYASTTSGECASSGSARTLRTWKSLTTIEEELKCARKT